MMEARLAKPEEAEMAVKWLAETPNNMFDPAVLGYPGTVTLCAENDNGTPDLFMPFQIVMFLESLGTRPDIRKRDKVEAMIKAVMGAVQFAQGAKIREIYFFGKDIGTNENAKRCEFETICEDKERGVSLFRLRVPDEG
jgi:hypothetical protein